MRLAGPLLRRCCRMLAPEAAGIPSVDSALQRITASGPAGALAAQAQCVPPSSVHPSSASSSGRAAANPWAGTPHSGWALSTRRAGGAWWPHGHRCSLASPPAAAAATAAAAAALTWQPPFGTRRFATRYEAAKRRHMRRLLNRASWIAARPHLRNPPRGSPGHVPPAPTPAPVIMTALPPLPDPEEGAPPHVARVGRITGPYKVEPQAVFAVVQLGPFQYKVTADDVIFHPKLKGVEVNDVLALGRVLLWGTPGATAIGRPWVPGASVVASVEEVFRDAKVHVFRKKARKRYSKHLGPRPQYTTLRILEVRTGATAELSAGGGGQGGAGASAVDGAGSP